MGKTKKLNIVMAGWGSGGHVFPIKSLVEFLGTKQDRTDKVDTVYRFGTRQSLEEKIFHQMKVSKKFKFQFVATLSGKFRRETKRISRLKNVRDIFLFGFWIIQSLVLILYYKVDVVFCKWGYAALPVVVAARILRKKIIVHESDVHPGLVNRIAAKFAQKSFTWFPKVLPNAQVVGQILSDQIIVWSIVKNQKNKWKLLETPIEEAITSSDKTKTQVLITWGWQWSKTLYNAFHDILTTTAFLREKFEFFIVWGMLNTEIEKQFKIVSDKNSNIKVHVFKFVSQQEMWMLCNHCDIGLCRAGTTSLAEQKLYDMKLFVVPIPWTHDQYDNTKFYVQKYWDILIDQKKKFLETMKEAFQKNQHFKKKLSTKDRKQEISTAKKTIIQELLLL